MEYGRLRIANFGSARYVGLPGCKSVIEKDCKQSRTKLDRYLRKQARSKRTTSQLDIIDTQLNLVLILALQRS